MRHTGQETKHCDSPVVAATSIPESERCLATAATNKWQSFLATLLMSADLELLMRQLIDFQLIKYSLCLSNDCQTLAFFHLQNRTLRLRQSDEGSEDRRTEARHRAGKHRIYGTIKSTSV